MKKKEEESFFQQFIRHSEHFWIRDNIAIYRAFEELSSLIPDAYKKSIAKSGGVVFIRAHNELAASFSSPVRENIILIYPDLITMLNRFDPSEGIAVLAHELGHIIFKHSHRNISNIDAQIEADRFASIIGLKKPLISVLKKYEMTLEVKTRIKNLALINSKV